MITRRIGKLLRGNISPFQIYSATVLGAWIGFSPGFAQSPGWMLVLLGALIVINANLFIAAIAILSAKLVYWLLLPLLFELGVFLLNGPFAGLFRTLANAPVTAWFGFEYYVVSAGTVVGLIWGLLLGLFFRETIMGFRKRMARAESDSAAYAKWSENKFVKAVAWILFGGLKGKKSWQQLAAGSRGLPIRPIGAVLVVALTVLGVMAFLFLQESILTTTTQSALESVNRATVDLGSAKLDLKEGKLRIENLAMADRENLKENIFAAGAIEADISGMSFLRRKYAFDRIEITEARSGSERRIPGRLIGKQPEPPEPEEAEEPDVYSIEEIIADAEKWKGRLQQLADILEKMTPEEKKPAAPDEPGWQDRLRERARALGYENVAADDIITDTPRLAIGEIVANGVVLKQMEADPLDVKAAHVSTQPWLSDAVPTIHAETRSGAYRFDFSAGAAARSASANKLSYAAKGLPVDDLAQSMEDPSKLPFKGGTFSVSGDGTLDPLNLDLPVSVEIRDTTLSAFGQSTQVDSITIPARLVGTLRSPGLSVDQDAFAQAVKGVASGAMRAKAEELIGDQVSEKLGKDADGVTEKLGGLLNLGGNKKKEEAPEEPTPAPKP